MTYSSVFHKHILKKSTPIKRVWSPVSQMKLLGHKMPPCPRPMKFMLLVRLICLLLGYYKQCLFIVIVTNHRGQLQMSSVKRNVCLYLDIHEYTWLAVASLGGQEGGPPRVSPTLVTPLMTDEGGVSLIMLGSSPVRSGVGYLHPIFQEHVSWIVWELTAKERRQFYSPEISLPACVDG